MRQLIEGSNAFRVWSKTERNSFATPRLAPTITISPTILARRTALLQLIWEEQLNCLYSLVTPRKNGWSKRTGGASLSFFQVFAFYYEGVSVWTHKPHGKR